MARLGIFSRCVMGLALCCLGCAKPIHRVEFSGQVFIATRGGENVRMGLVVVRAIDAAKMPPFLSAARQRWREAHGDLVLREAELKARQEAAAARCRALFREVETYWDDKNPAADEVTHERFEARYLALQARLPSAYEAVQEFDRKRRILRDSFQRIAPGEIFFVGLPAATDSTRTDANGDFHLSMIAGEPIVLVAVAERQILSDLERYYWMVSIDPTKRGDRRVLLSNDNTISSGSPESLISPEDIAHR